MFRFVIRIFRHPFFKYLTARWKWQIRASIGTAKKFIGICDNIDRVFFPCTMRVSDNIYLQMAIWKWTKWWVSMDIVGYFFFGSRYLRSALNIQFHAPPHVFRSAFALNEPPRPLWYNYLSCHPFSNILYITTPSQIYYHKHPGNTKYILDGHWFIKINRNFVN